MQDAPHKSTLGECASLVPGRFVPAVTLPTDTVPQHADSEQRANYRAEGNDSYSPLGPASGWACQTGTEGYARCVNDSRVVGVRLGGSTLAEGGTSETRVRR